MAKDTHDTDDTARRSGAPEYGGATTHGSHFGGEGLLPGLLRAVARLARSIEAASYRKLRALDVASGDEAAPGRPKRVKAAHEPLRT